MQKKLILLLAVVLFLGFSAAVFAAESDFTKDRIISIATEAVTAKGVTVAVADIVYDEDGKLWSEKLGAVGYEDKTPNHGILKQGFLKNYKIVFFDFKEPLKDIWVFVDKDTGEVLTVYQE